MSSTIETHQTVGITDQEANHWLKAVFLAFVWETENPERVFADYLEKAQALTPPNPSLVKAIESCARQGKLAVQLTKELYRKIDQGLTQQEIKSWITEQATNQSERITQHLNITLEKRMGFITNKREQFKKNTQFKLSLPQVILNKGLHPQSLRALKPAQEWNVYLDETGSNFGISATELNESDKTLGRVVALAVPVGSKLQPLEGVVHSSDLGYAKIEALLQAMTSNTCGILGATLKKDLRNYSWMAAINQLTRWLLLMLPIKGVTKVRVHIENRAPYTDTASLHALQDTLENELKLLAPKRFADLHLSLAIMDKSHPYNGYVDAIANCWGSNDDTKYHLLARTAWPDICLLQTTHLDRVENLYRSLADNTEISASDWFKVCAASTQEPEHSLLHIMLEQLGEEALTNPKLWSAYLNEVRHRLITKSFTTSQLSAALSWLETYQNTSYHLPAILQLKLFSLNLASGNHGGATHLQQAEKVLTLVNQLKDEDAVEACQAVLRVVVRATHHYDFITPVALVEQWLAYPVAVPSLLNHAKLHSTLGQLYAFQGNQQAALKAFDTAATFFNKLSDASTKYKDIQQTNIYKGIVLLDAKDAAAAPFIFDRVHESTTKQGISGIERLARSGGDYRFIHYLLLRLLVSQPELSEERLAYLGQAAEWKDDLGHPWMLINAYRAWLLNDAKQTDLATDYMQMAITTCFESEGVMLDWMGHCLLALAESLALSPNHSEIKEIPKGNYPVTALPSLAKAKNNKERLTNLAKLLPFNFH